MASVPEREMLTKKGNVSFIQLLFHTSLGHLRQLGTVYGKILVGVPPCVPEVLGVSLGGLKAENAESADWDDCLTRV